MVAVAVCDAPASYGGPEQGSARGAGRARFPPTGEQRPATSEPPPLSEAVLVRLWAGQRFPASALVTRQGVPVRVLHPGRRGRGAGPDFRDALIATPSGGLLRGDLELHVRASDFRAHGHHRDRRYDGVVLHVVFEDDLAEDTHLASGRRAPVVALAPWARKRAEELAAWLAGPGLWREPCHNAVARLGREEVLRKLEALGDRRFREQEAALAVALREQGPGEALYRALLAGLGYGGDRRLLEAVAELLPWRELASRLASAPSGEQAVLTEALLLGVAGLLPSQRGAEPGDRHEMGLEEQFRIRGRGLLLAQGPLPGGAPTSASSVEPSAVRPANHPARRLAGLAQLLVRHGLILREGAAPGGPLEEPVSRLIADWTVPAQGYWQRCLAPGATTSRPPGALIGRGRAIELLVNALLPWAAAEAEARGDSDGAARARACFARLPRPSPYGALAFLEANLRTDGGPLPLDARRQQGLLALYKTECTQGGCGRCPLS